MVDEVLQAVFEETNSLGCILCGRETETVGVFVPDRVPTTAYRLAAGSFIGFATTI